MNRRRWVGAVKTLFRFAVRALLLLLAVAAVLFGIDHHLRNRPLQVAPPSDVWVVYNSDVENAASLHPEKSEFLDYTLGTNVSQWRWRSGSQLLVTQGPTGWIGYTVPGLWSEFFGWRKTPLFPGEGHAMHAVGDLTGVRSGESPAMAFAETIQSLQHSLTEMGRGSVFSTDSLITVETPLSSNGVRAVLRLESFESPSANGLLEIHGEYFGNALDIEFEGVDWTLSAGGPMIVQLWQAMSEWRMHRFGSPSTNPALRYWLDVLEKTGSTPAVFAVKENREIEHFIVLSGLAPESAGSIPMQWGPYDGMALPPGPWGQQTVCAATPEGWLSVSHESMMPGALAALEAAQETQAAAVLAAHRDALAYLGSSAIWAAGYVPMSLETRRVYAERDASLPLGQYRLRAFLGSASDNASPAALPAFAERSAPSAKPEAGTETLLYDDGRTRVLVEHDSGNIVISEHLDTRTIAFDTAIDIASLGVQDGVWKGETAQGGILAQRVTILPGLSGLLVTWEYETQPHEVPPPVRISVAYEGWPVAGVLGVAKNSMFHFSGREQVMSETMRVSAGLLPIPALDEWVPENLGPVKSQVRFDNPAKVGFALDANAPESEWLPVCGPQAVAMASVGLPQTMHLNWYSYGPWREPWSKLVQRAEDSMAREDATWNGAHPPEAVQALRKYGIQLEATIDDSRLLSTVRGWLPSLLHTVVRALNEFAGPEAAAPYAEAGISSLGIHEQQSLEQEPWLAFILLDTLHTADSLYPSDEAVQMLRSARRDLDVSAWRLARGRAGGSSALLAPQRVDDSGRLDVTGLVLTHHALERAAAFVETEPYEEPLPIWKYPTRNTVPTKPEVPPRWRERMAELRVELAAALVGGECCINLPPHLDVAAQSPEFPYAVLRGLSELPGCSPKAVIEESPRDAAIRAAAEALLASGAVYQPPA